jgi:hypothetical protein
MIEEEDAMELTGQESLDASGKELTDTERALHHALAHDAKDTEWVIERIQDSFNSRAR